jgi:drug/metabolite transporter (DMT)-like permease
MRPATALLALHVAVALFGFAALFGEWIALPPVAIVLGRTVVAALTLAIVRVLWRPPAAHPSTAMAINGGLLALHWVAFFAAVQSAGVATALLGYASYPVFVLLLERRQSSRASRAAETATAIAVVLGLVLLVPEFSWSSLAARGLVWGIASGFMFALLTLRNRALLAASGALSIALWQNAFAAVWLAPIVMLTGDAAMPEVRDTLLLLLLGVFCTALAHTLFIVSMRHVTAHTASVVSLLEPVYGIALAALLLGQWPDLRTLAGAVLILGAAAATTRRSAAA